MIKKAKLKVEIQGNVKEVKTGRNSNKRFNKKH